MRNATTTRPVHADAAAVGGSTRRPVTVIRNGAVRMRSGLAASASAVGRTGVGGGVPVGTGAGDTATSTVAAPAFPSRSRNARRTV
jgi:hypothetical protein